MPTNRNSEPASNESKGAEQNILRVGQLVRLKSNRETTGVVMEIIPGEPESRIKVFTGSQPQIFYSSQLEAAEESDLGKSLSAGEFHAYLSALQIRFPGLSTLYSLHAARVDFIPYQFRPVLRFIKSDRPRLLIADAVGVGKTIEAGLILKELQARGDVKSILIVCPRPLVTEQKWENEMKRFDEKFTALDGSTLRYCINEMDLDGEWPDQYKKAIIPFSLFDETLLYGPGPEKKHKTAKGLLNLDPSPRFDLVIVDEAHHIRNPETFAHKGVRHFCDNAEAAVFLTATPIQLGSHDLFVLLNVLRPELIIDREGFDHMAEPNPFINRAVSQARAQGMEWAPLALAALDDAAETGWGRSIIKNNPEYKRIRSILSSPTITPEERVDVITGLEGLHTFAGVINRTRRRDIGDFTIRKPETLTADFTPQQRKLYDDLLDTQRNILSRLHGDINVKFMMTTIMRQAASSLFGLVPFLEEILTRRLDDLALVEADHSAPLGKLDFDASLDRQIASILEQARSLDSNDKKLEALKTTIAEKQDLENNKIMLFSSFRHTLNYLHTKLSESGIRVGLVHGDVPDEERVDLRARFMLDRNQERSLDVLLFSEVGCEGLDYQFCDCLINYDLPWNPMRIEQRIGRIDRKGQKSESVTIINMVTPGTIDADIYERCLLRIGVFNTALGAGEEILGEITSEIKSIAENVKLTEAERNSKFQQLADNKIRLVQEQEKLESQQQELFGIMLPAKQLDKEIDEASSHWLSPESLRKLISVYLQRIFGKEQEFILGDKPLKTLRLSQEARNELLKEFQKLPRQRIPGNKQWESWLKGGEPHLLVTFDAKCASENQNAAFLTPLHPLVKQAANSFDNRKPVQVSLTVKSTLVPQGTYEFGIFQWHFHGIREDLVMRPVSSSEELTKNLSKLLEIADSSSSEGSAINDIESSKQSLESQHYQLWLTARKSHVEKTKQLGEFKKESLATSHRARTELLKEQLKEATNEKIRIMRRAQISAAEADFSRRTEELNEAVLSADLTSEAVAFGYIEVKA